MVFPGWGQCSDCCDTTGWSQQGHAARKKTAPAIPTGCFEQPEEKNQLGNWLNQVLIKND